MLDPVDPGTKDLYRLGGVSAIVLSASYVVITVLYVVGGAVPDGAQESLTYLAEHAASRSRAREAGAVRGRRRRGRDRLIDR